MPVNSRDIDPGRFGVIRHDAVSVNHIVYEQSVESCMAQ